MNIKDAGRSVVKATAEKFGPFSDFLYRFCKAYVLAYKNFDYRFQSNGELHLLNALKKFPLKTIFDVGANKGEWALAALTRFPHAKIHSFEIVPATFSTLQENLTKYTQVQLNPKGLSNTAAIVEIGFSPGHDGVSTIIHSEKIHDIPWQKVVGEVIRGDDYCRSNGIEHIDVLKIDVEGAEPLVIEGLSSMLNQSAVTVVQFEYGLANIYSRFLLKDYYEFFEKRGYIVGKLMPRGVWFKEYHPLDEDFIGPNYVAVLKSRLDVIDAIRDPHGPKRF